MRITGDSAEFWGRSGSRALFAILTMVLMAITFLSASPAWAQTGPELTVNKTDTPPNAVDVGEEITYTIEVKNTGANKAKNVTLTDELPAGVVFQSPTPPTVTGGGTCTAPDPGDNGTVRCDLNNIDPNVTKTVTFTVRAVRGGVVENTATADGSNTEPASDSARTRVGPNLTFDKIDDRDPINVGGNILYTLRVTNEGSTPRGPGELVVIDELPIGDVRLVSVDSNDFDCDRLDPPTGRVRCVSRAALPAGETASIKITVDPDDAGTVENTAELRFNRFLIDSDTETTVVRNDAATDEGTTDEGTTDEGTTDEGTTDEGTPGEGTPGEGTPGVGEASAGGVTLTCEQLIKLVEEGGASVAQYSTEVSQKCEGSANVIDGTIPGGSLADTGGPTFGLLMASLLLVGGGLFLRARLRR